MLNYLLMNNFDFEVEPSIHNIYFRKFKLFNDDIKSSKNWIENKEIVKAEISMITSTYPNIILSTQTRTTCRENLKQRSQTNEGSILTTQHNQTKLS